MNKITIIGAGNVGSTIAYTLSIMGLAKDIVMIDIKNDLALGEALDIRQGTPFSSNCTIYAGSYADAADSNIVILTSGVDQRQHLQIHHAAGDQIRARRDLYHRQQPG